MRTCPKCGQRVRDEYALCPFCSANVETGVGLPHDTGDDAFAVQGGWALGGAVMLLCYYMCGGMYIISSNMLYATHHGMAHVDVGHYLRARAEAPWIGFGVPILVPGLLFLLLRRRFPHFARGLGYSSIVAIVVTLGAPFLCSSSGPG